MSKKSKVSRKKKNIELQCGTNLDESQNDFHLMSPYFRILESRKIMCGESLPVKFKYREAEIQLIEKNIEKCLGKGKYAGPRVVMITGSPGVGKTLSTNYVLKKNQYKVIALNSNLISKKKDVQRIVAEEILQEELENKDLTTFKIINRLQKMNNVQPCILYVEEVELFFSSYSEFLSEDFFSLFYHKNLKIMLVGISNTIDALEKYGYKMHIKPSEVTNIVFNPYTVDEIKGIMQEKIQMVFKRTGINITIADNLLKYAANKMSDSKKGDMRMVFEFLNSLSYILLPSLDSSNIEISSSIQVTVKDIQNAQKKMHNEKQSIINRIPFQQQVVLVAFYSLITKDESIYLTEDQLKRQVKRVYQKLNLKEIKKDDSLNQQLSDLITYHLIVEYKNKKDEIPRKFLLKVGLQELKFYFEGHSVLKKLLF